MLLENTFAWLAYIQNSAVYFRIFEASSVANFRFFPASDFWKKLREIKWLPSSLGTVNPFYHCIVQPRGKHIGSHILLDHSDSTILPFTSLMTGACMLYDETINLIGKVIGLSICFVNYNWKRIKGRWYIKSFTPCNSFKIFTKFTFPNNIARFN